jgi:ABC-type sugar transport system ATPase subunit
MPPDHRPILEATGLRKAFDGNVVLADVDFTLARGEVHAVVGENGAGKSTLIKILGGVHRPDAGSLRIDGEPVTLRSPHEAIARGVIVIHQELSLAPHLSAEENIFLGHFPRTPLGLVRRSEMRRRTGEVLGRLGIRIDQRRPVGELSIAQQQMVEIAKAISFNARILVLDEPTAVLDEGMVGILFDLVARLKVEGIGVVFISHHLEEIFRVADTVTVLRDGRRTGVSAVAAIDQEWLVAKMIGRDFPVHATRARAAGEPAIELSNVTVPGAFEDVSFRARQGEIVGLAGLVGAGRTEVAQAILGLRRPVAGQIEIFGRPVRLRNPRQAARRGIAYLSEDRKALGLLPNRPVRENIVLSNLSRFARFGVLSPLRERAFTREVIRRLDVRAASMETEIRYLSGGNQQKALIGRALAVSPRILIFDEPTRGVDIGAKREIYRFIEELVEGGMCVILISSEMEEILRLSDRIVVLRRGRVAATLERGEATEAAIMRAAALAEDAVKEPT